MRPQVTSNPQRMTHFSPKTSVTITQKCTTAENYRQTGHKLQFRHDRLTLIPTSWYINVRLSAEDQQTNTMDKWTNRHVGYLHLFIRWSLTLSSWFANCKPFKMVYNALTFVGIKLWTHRVNHTFHKYAFFCEIWCQVTTIWTTER